GADVNMPTIDRCLIPLYLAAQNTCVEMVKLLLDKGALINSRMWDKWTPLIEAIKNRHEPTIDLLLEWGTDPN
ncbi:ankyrin repeat-containing domain protein, partial [Hyaloscypha sp. PMI_1271]